MPDAVQISVEEGLGQAAGLDLPPCLFNREPLPGVHLPVGVGFLIVHGDGEVEHEGVGGGEVMAVIKAHLPRFKADLLPHLAHGGVLGVLAPIPAERLSDAGLVERAWRKASFAVMTSAASTTSGTTAPTGGTDSGREPPPETQKNDKKTAKKARKPLPFPPLCGTLYME